MRRSTLRTIFLLSVFGATAVGACSLNPQPIPPGDQPDAGGGQDFGGGGGEDAGLDTPTTGQDSGVGNNGDAGEDGGVDASDAGSDDAGDAEADAHDE